MTGDRLGRYFSTQVLDARRFHLRPSEASKGGIHLLGGGYERCRRDYVIDRAGFPFTIVEFVAGGAGQLVMNGKASSLIPGTLFAYGPGIAHRIACDPVHPMDKYFLVLSGRGVAALLRSSQLAPGEVVQLSRPDQIRRILDDVIDFGLSDRGDRGACCLLAFQYLMLKVADMTVPQSKTGARAFHTYQRCRQFMEARGLMVDSLREVAVACHVDEAYLCRLFQRFGRERPSHYLQHIRMNHAMTLLQTTDRLIKQIAEELRFSDTANFTRAFRAWYGVPPKAIRRE